MPTESTCSQRWICPNCETANPLTMENCEVCGREIPISYRPPIIRSFELSEPSTSSNVITLQWRTEYATTAMINGHNVPVSGSTYLDVAEEYQLIVTNTNGTTTRTLHVEYPLPKIHSFTCSPKKYLHGDKIHISWDVENYTQIFLDGRDVSSKTFIDKIADTQTTYKLEVINYQKRVSKSLKTQIIPYPVIFFYASKQTVCVMKHETVTLTWNVQNAESCSLLYPDGTNMPCETNGSVNVTPTDTCTYILRTLALDKKTYIDAPLTIKYEATVYLFGNFGKGYTQCLNDQTNKLFQSLVNKTKANKQLFIHRDGTLMYYTYIHRLRTGKPANRYIGISYITNNQLIDNINNLLAGFEMLIKQIAKDGIILKQTIISNPIRTNWKCDNLDGCFCAFLFLGETPPPFVFDFSHEEQIISPSIDKLDKKVCRKYLTNISTSIQQHFDRLKTTDLPSAHSLKYTKTYKLLFTTDRQQTPFTAKDISDYQNVMIVDQTDLKNNIEPPLLGLHKFGMRIANILWVLFFWLPGILFGIFCWGGLIYVISAAIWMLGKMILEYISE